ncbi:MAG: BON domain-containing protein [Betaproteobacteria bacterium]
MNVLSTSLFQRLTRPLALGLTLAVGATTLTGCLPLVAGGALMSGLVVADRRTSGAQLEDQGIELRAAARLRESLGEQVHINVTSYNRQVILTGEVPNAQDKAKAQDIAKGVDNVASTLNELAIMVNSTLTERSNDLITSGRIKASLLDAKDLFANAFKVTTERGVAYIMGRVTAREAKRATEVISSVPGVKKVVRVLEIISEEELARLQPPVQTPSKN